LQIINNIVINKHTSGTNKTSNLSVKIISVYETICAECLEIALNCINWNHQVK